MILPTAAELDAYDMAPIMALFNDVPERNFINEPAGVNHYRLLRWISENIPHHYISELGTYMGLGTMSLRTENNFITSYDLNHDHLHIKSIPRNVNLMCVANTQEFYSGILYSQLIFVDTWHEGKMERAVYDFLVANNWKGILIYDDIYYNDAMKAFWASIDHPGKVDLTHLGHSTGTGAIEFI